MSDITPFPNGKKPAPRLPKMNEQERKLWAASHQLPKDILLIYEDEMRYIQQMSMATIREIKAWKVVGRALCLSESPEEVLQIVGDALKRLAVLEAKAKETPPA